MNSAPGICRLVLPGAWQVAHCPHWCAITGWHGGSRRANAATPASTLEQQTAPFAGLIILLPDNKGCNPAFCLPTNASTRQSGGCLRLPFSYFLHTTDILRKKAPASPCRTRTRDPLHGANAAPCRLLVATTLLLLPLVSGDGRITTTTTTTMTAASSRSTAPTRTAPWAATTTLLAAASRREKWLRLCPSGRGSTAKTMLPAIYTATAPT